jgi:hypothetical protein
MNSFSLKIIACSLMIIDHLGIIFFPDNPFLRIIGRLAFPMFAYLIAEGYRHTKDPTSYLGRLFLFSLISQPFYMFGFKYPHLEFNIFFTLTAGLYGIYAYEKSKNFSAVLFAAISCEFVRVSFGAPGVLLIFAMYYFSKDYKKMALWLFSIGIMSCIRKNIWMYIQDPQFVLTWAYLTKHSVAALAQPLCFLAVPIIALYNGKQGPKMKYFFYLFYPGHLAILGLIRTFLHK